jgi:uncharacterized protein (TIGR02217 family)
MAYLDAYLQPCPGYGWEGGPTFKTQIVELKSGRERRNAEWARVRHKYTAPFNNISKVAYQNIKQMHLVCRGMLNAFRFRDELDFQADNEQFGTGNGTRRDFQLSKIATFDGVSYTREVFALVAVPVITVNGTPTSAFAVNTRTGLVIFDAAPANNAVLRWTGEFDIWVRFATDDLPFSIDNVDAVNGSVSLLEIAPPDEDESSA